MEFVIMSNDRRGRHGYLVNPAYDPFPYGGVGFQFVEYAQ
jgi:hypothetical protein